MKDSLTLCDERKFNQSLAITMLWCKNSLSESNSIDSLWPIELRPHINIRDFNIDTTRKIEEIDRLNAVKSEHTNPNLFQLRSIEGRVLIFYPELSLSDGIVSIEFSGFFDEDDCPPWGTWFYLQGEKEDGDGEALYSWIPEAFVSAVEKALESDQYNCLRWLQPA